MSVGQQASGALANMDMTTLVKIVRDIIEGTPNQHLEYLAVSDLVALNNLTIRDKLTVPTPNFVTVGAAGAPAYTNAWVNYGSPYHAAGYWRDPFGFIHFRGVIKSGAVGSSAFTLPPGFRPASDVITVVLSNNAVGRLDIDSDGTVTPQNPSNNANVCLDGVYFQAV